MKICVLGLGLMGSALARRLRGLGYSLALYNRSKDKAVKLGEELNVEVAETPARCCEGSDLATILVSDDNALIDISVMPEGFAEKSMGKDIVNMSTVSTSISTRVCKAVEMHGGNYVEAPVYGSVSEVLEGKLTAIVSSNKDLSENVKQFLSSIAKKVIYVGEVPKAMALKLALNHLNMVVIATLSETLPFLKAYGIDYKYFEELVKDTWMEPIITRFLKRAIEEMPPRFRVESSAKDLQCFVESARVMQLNTPIAAAAMHRYLEATLHDYGDKDYPNVVKYVLDIISKKKQDRISL